MAGLLDWISGIFGGGGGSGSTGDDASTFPTPPVPAVGATPYTGGTAYDPTAATPSNWGAGASSSAAQPTSQNWVNQLQKLSESLKDPAHSPAPYEPKSMGSQVQAQSAGYHGGDAVMANIYNILNSRRYTPIGYSGGSSAGGLLGRG